MRISLKSPKARLYYWVGAGCFLASALAGALGALRVFDERASTFLVLCWVMLVGASLVMLKLSRVCESAYEAPETPDSAEDASPR